MNNSQQESQIFYDMVKKIVQKEMLNEKNYLPFLIPGKIVSISGNFANVKINNSNDITPHIPINPSIVVSVNDNVWILKVNFYNTDMLILCKRLA